MKDLILCFNERFDFVFLFVGLIDILVNYLTKTSKLYHKNVSLSNETPSTGAPEIASVVECITQLLSLLKSMLDRVTMYVKEVLQVTYYVRSCNGRICVLTAKLL